MIIGLLLVFVGLCLIGYGFVKFAQFLYYWIKGIDPSEKKAAPINPFIQAHQLDDHNKKTYEEYLEWAQINDKAVIFDFESFHDKKEKRQAKKINRLFK
jgi:hypothetical protein